MVDEAQKKEIISFLMKNDFLLSPDILDIFEYNENVDSVKHMIDSGKPSDHIIAYIKELIKDNKTQKKEHFDETSSFSENKNTPIQEQQKENNQKTQSKYNFEVVRDYELASTKREVSHFVSYFSARFTSIERLLKQRKQVSGVVSIARLRGKKERDNACIIGMISSIDRTKNDNLMLTVEDKTGEIKVLVNKNNKELFDLAKDLVKDEVIGILGMTGDNIIFMNEFIQPDIPLDKEFKKYHSDVNAVFLSDLHFGSKYFLSEEFDKFISWIRQETGSDKQKEIASKVGYIFIAGDVVDGVGIYPGQDNELTVKDIYQQYKIATDQLSRIPTHIPVIIIPGNHDALRLSEPQPKLSKTYAAPLYDLPNVLLLSNPSMVNICSDEKFSGFDILLYHGYSFDHYVANVDEIRKNGGYDRADMIMKFLLKRRHLAPSYTSTLIIPEITNDALFIDKVPDFFITGHIHKTAVSNYRNITLICGSCWQSTTSFQEKVGHHPEPAKVPVVNLKSRKVTILNFSK